MHDVECRRIEGRTTGCLALAALLALATLAGGLAGRHVDVAGRHVMRRVS